MDVVAEGGSTKTGEAIAVGVGQVAVGLRMLTVLGLR
jgi:hypothetical protein